MRDFIANRNTELEDKTDFAAYLAIASLAPPKSDCELSLEAFTAASNSLLA
jgi:hypothetical protein